MSPIHIILFQYKCRLGRRLALPEPFDIAFRFTTNAGSDGASPSRNRSTIRFHDRHPTALSTPRRHVIHSGAAGCLFIPPVFTTNPIQPIAAKSPNFNLATIGPKNFRKFTKFLEPNSVFVVYIRDCVVRFENQNQAYQKHP